MGFLQRLPTTTHPVKLRARQQLGVAATAEDDKICRQPRADAAVLGQVHRVGCRAGGEWRVGGCWGRDGAARGGSREQGASPQGAQLQDLVHPTPALCCCSANADYRPAAAAAALPPLRPGMLVTACGQSP